MKSKISDIVLSIVDGIQRSLKTLRSSTRLTIGSILLAIILILGIFEPLVNSYRLGGRSPVELGLYERALPPSFEHPLGTDMLGRDILALVLVGLRYSLLVGAIAGGIATLIGTVIGLLAGYIGGKIDAVLNSITNGVLILPTLPLLMAIVAYVRMNMVLISITLAIFTWPWSARTIRAQVLSLKERPYIELAKVTNLNDIEIVFKEIFVGLIPYIMVGLSFSVIGCIIAETSLRMIGLGPAEIPTLGFILGWAMTYGALAQGYYTLVLAPAILLILLFISLNLINVGLDEVFNPRLKKITGL
ncbi:MAG: ABC transporter permease [Thermoprotei archaeon]|nr:MAG: ABC transporter permease [Thermoprotei archaeon]